MAQSEGPTPDTTPRGGKDKRKDGMTESWAEFMQSHTVIQRSRNDGEAGWGKKKEHLTNVEEKASLPSS